MMTADIENPTLEAVEEENKVPMRRQESKCVKAEIKDEFNEAELTILEEWATLMEMNANIGFLDEASTSFGLVFEKIKQKKFSPNQRVMKLKILTKIVSLHNIKHSYDEAHTWAIKALECLDANDPPSLVIETLNQSAEAFTSKSLFQKAKPLIEKSVALSTETYGKESRAYARSLITYAGYLSDSDECQKANAMYEIALKIVSKEEGERSVAAAKIMALAAQNNYYFQSCSTKNFTVASQQAETALQVIEEKLGRNNYLIVTPKNTMAAIMKEKAWAISDKEEKLKLLSETEKLEAYCLTILTSSLGDYNPFTAHLMLNTGVTYRDSGKNYEAEELFTKSLAIQKKIQGEDVNLALSHLHLGNFYFMNIQEYGKAEGHFLDSARILEKVHGPASSFLGNNYDWLISLYRTTGEVEKENEQQQKKAEWEKLQKKKDEEQEKKDEEEENNEKKKEEKLEEMTLEELIKFVTVSDTIEP